MSDDGSATPTGTRAWRTVVAAALLVAGSLPSGLILAKAIATVPSAERLPAAKQTSSCGRLGVATTPEPVSYALVPGETVNTSGSVRVSGTATYPSAGQILLVTVYLPRLSWLSFDLVKRDCRSELLSRSQVLGGNSPAEDEAEDIALMGWSKETALQVAMTRLGYQVDLTGGGVVIDSFCLEENSDRSCARQSPAAAQLEIGDAITEFDGTAIHLINDLSAALAGRQVGDVVTVVVRRGQTTVTTQVTLTSSSQGRAIIGLVPNPRPPEDLQFRFPFPIEVDSKELQGPSAGLAFTLAIIDLLTPGELAGGRVVAATGEIDLSGRVGEIGGLPQKTAAVIAQGDVEVFLVPASQAPEALKVAAGSPLRVIPVKDLDEALTALADLGGNAKDLGITTAPTTTTIR